MIWLWIAAALVSAALAALMVQRAVSAAQAPRGVNPALAVYRRQMAELDELAERGVLAEVERRSVRAETGRRLLAAADRGEAPLRRSGPGVILIAAAAAPLAAIVAYLALGAPNYADQPFKARLAAWRAADPQTLVAPQMAAILRVIAAERPTDPEPLRQLAIAEFASREPTEAIQALHRAIAIAPSRPDLWELLGQALVAEGGGDADAEPGRVPPPADARSWQRQRTLFPGQGADRRRRRRRRPGRLARAAGARCRPAIRAALRSRRDIAQVSNTGHLRRRTVPARRVGRRAADPGHGRRPWPRG